MSVTEDMMASVWIVIVDIGENWVFADWNVDSLFDQLFLFIFKIFGVGEAYDGHLSTISI